MSALALLSRRFRRDRRGIAAVEFALIAPLMLTLYFGVVEVAHALMINRKVTTLTRTLADLTAAQTGGTITESDLNNVFDAASTVMMPYTGVAAKRQVASVVIDANRVAKVCWVKQDAGVSNALARGQEFTVPDALRIANTSLIVARASFDFEPAVGYLITGTIRIGNHPAYMRPRSGKAGGTGPVEQIQRENVTMCPGF